MPISDASLLKNIPLFELLDDEELKTLADNLDEVNYISGQTIFSAGDVGGTMLIVYSGKVELFLQDKLGDRVHLGHVTPGNLFGELSLLDNEERSASAKAVENSQLFVVDRNDIEQLIKAHPHAALDMMAILSKRIRDANILVRDRVTRNVNEEIAVPVTLGERVSDFLTMIAGDIRFVYASMVWFVVWIVWNLDIIPGIKAFDPFPYGLLTMVVSLEAIFLSLFVLISQNRQAAREKIRNDIEYEVNLKAEVEIRDLTKQVEQLQEIVLKHLASINAFQAARYTEMAKKQEDYRE
ncbi:MAG: DUF1003 domain-containing protein [Chloroflexi bacterium]|nr:DUF1003 domain-containing protein [Chloroflexota bacterium]